MRPLTLTVWNTSVGTSTCTMLQRVVSDNGARSSTWAGSEEGGEVVGRGLKVV